MEKIIYHRLQIIDESNLIEVFFKFIKRVSLSFYIIYVDIYLLNRVTYRFIECENYFSFF